MRGVHEVELTFRADHDRTARYETVADGAPDALGRCLARFLRETGNGPEDVVRASSRLLSGRGHSCTDCGHRDPGPAHFGACPGACRAHVRDSVRTALHEAREPWDDCPGPLCQHT